MFKKNKTLPEAKDAAASEYRIDAWTAEFADAACERRFRDRSTPANARHLFWVIIIWAVSDLVFIPEDIINLGAREAGIAVTARITLFLVLIGSLPLLLRRPDLAASGALLTPLLLFGFGFIFLYYFLMPPELSERLLGITLVLLIAVYVLMPNRFVLSTLVVAYALIGSLLCRSLTGIDGGLQDVSTTAILLLLPTSAGMFAAYRLQMLHRREFAALEQAEREIERRRLLEQELKRQAATDPLTGLYNRRHYEKLFARELARARRHDRPLSLCVLDIDHFKRVNDRFGHAAGDAALCMVADVCRAELREADLVGRLGGEEFVILLPDTEVEGAAEVSERIRGRLAATEVIANGRRFRMTATFGLTERRAEDTDIAELIQRADAALYQGKAAGRDRIFTG